MKPIEIQTSKTGSTAAEQTTSIMPSRLAASAGALAPTLASTEQKQLEDCEAIIAAGWDNFVRVGQALAIIRNNELYRQSFKTF